MANKTGFQDYYAMFKHFEVLPADRERAYLIRIHDGDHVAREEFICHNMRLVLSCVLRFCNIDDPKAMDLVGAGTLGLLKAIDDFKVSYDNRFSTYAVWWIQAKIRKELVVLSPRVLRYKTLDTKYRAARKKLTEELKRPPTDIEIFGALEWTPMIQERYQEDQKKRVYSLDSVSIEGGTDPENDPLVSDVDDEATIQMLIKSETGDRLSKALEGLAPMQADIVRRHYGLGNIKSETYDQLATFYSYTRERIRQIENKALRKLWHLLKEDG